MSNVMAFENINKVGLMNVLKVSSSLQPLQSNKRTYELLERQGDFERNLTQHEKIEEKVEPELDQGVIYKKVRVDYDGASVRTEPVVLSSVVDEQLQKLPKEVNEKIQKILNQPKAKNTGRSRDRMAVKPKILEQVDEPLRIVSFKFDAVRQMFMYQVEWKERENGVKPKNSFMDKKEMMKLNPGLIVAYYEAQIARTFENTFFDEE